MADYNLGYETTTLASQYEQIYHIPKVEATTKKIEEERKKIQAINHFLAQIDQDSQESLRIDYRNDPKKLAMVDELRQICPDLFPHGQYEWKEKSLDRLIKSLDDHINQVISPTISQLTADLTQTFYEHNEVIEIMVQILKQSRDFIERILSNIAKAS